MRKKNGITVIKHYIDRAFSAKTDNRPEFQQMIKDSGKKLFDAVLVWIRTSAPLPVARQTRNVC
jgi:DNA invertase Pin-like site-specific DNA recombinase